MQVQPAASTLRETLLCLNSNLRFKKNHLQFLVLKLSILLAMIIHEALQYLKYSLYLSINNYYMLTPLLK